MYVINKIKNEMFVSLSGDIFMPFYKMTCAGPY